MLPPVLAVGAGGHEIMTRAVIVAAAHVFESGPNWAEKLTAWATLGTGIVIAITAVAAMRSLKDARKTRHTQILFDFSKSWDEAEIRESAALTGSTYKGDALLELVERAMSDTPTQDDLDAFYKVEIWPNLIENLGVLVNQGAIRPKVVYKNFGAGIIVAWKSWQQGVERIREINGYPETYRYFQELARKMAEFEARERRRRLKKNRGSGSTSNLAASESPQESEAAADKNESSSRRS